MPKLVCNGFSMFSNYVRISLEEERGRKFNGLDKDLIEAAGPLWEALSIEEKKGWKERAKRYKKTDEFVERKRQVRAKRSPNPRPPKKKDDEEEKVEDPIDFDLENAEESIGVPVSRLQPMSAASAIGDANNEDSAMTIKRQADVAKLHDFLDNATGRTLKDIKRCRFLFLSMQTYGCLENNVCIPAEVSLVEFSLQNGIIDEFVAVLGDWTIPLHLQDRAKLHAEKYHKIPLEKTFHCENYLHDKTELLKQLLGRIEPGIARSHNICVGLYKDGLVELPDTSEGVEDDVEVSRRDPSTPLLPGDVHGRRWVICVSSEMPMLIAALKFIRQERGIDYDGVPCDADRYIALDTFVEAMAQYVSGTPIETGMRALRNIDKAVSASFDQFETERTGGTFWDDQEQVFCAHHKHSRNLSCAFATCVRGCFAGFLALKDCYSLPFSNY